MNLRIPSNSRTHSFALIIAMLAIFVLSVNAALLWYSMKVEMKLAQRSDSEPQLLWLGRSGVELARYVLAEEANIPGEPYDALNQIWAGGPGGAGETNSPLSGISLDNYQIGKGSVSIKIIDLERYVNINTASPQLIQQTLTLMGVDADDISVVSDSILDWIDTDDNPRLAGAENDYYQSLNPPYYCKDAPIDDISELLLIKGITPAMYNGGSDTNSQPASQKLGVENSPFQSASYPFGLKDVFTPYSDGKININTADANVLQMIPGVDEDTANAIIQTRAGPDGVEGTEDDTPFRNVSEVATAGVNPQIVQELGRVCDVRSTTFEIHVTAHYLDYSREYIAILYRNSPTDIRVVSFYWKQAENQNTSNSSSASSTPAQ
jgi:general secretion pathway protein K